MSFEKPSSAQPPIEQLELNESSVANIATEAVEVIQKDSRFQEVVRDLAGDPNLAKAFHDDLLSKFESLAQDWKKAHETDAELPALKLDMEEVLLMARQVAVDLGLDVNFFENDFETAPATVPDGISPLSSEPFEQSSEPVLDSPASDEHLAELSRQALASLQTELAGAPLKDRLISPTEIGSFHRVLEAIDGRDEFRPLSDFLAQDTPESEALKQKLAARLEKETVAYARKKGELLKTEDLLKIVTAVAQAEGLGSLVPKKLKPDVERRALKPEPESHAEALRARAKVLVEIGLPPTSGDLPPLEKRRHQRTVDTARKLNVLWAKPENREAIIAEADRMLSGWLSKDEPGETDSRLLKQRIFTALLLAAEKNWTVAKSKPSSNASQIRGTSY
jgi:hypothetical protein